MHRLVTADFLKNEIQHLLGGRRVGIVHPYYTPEFSDVVIELLVVRQVLRRGIFVGELRQF